MSRQPLFDNLTQLRLSAFRKALEEQLSNPQYEELPFEDRLSLLVDRECQQREHNRIQRHISRARFHQSAFMEDIDFSPGRGLQRNQVLQLAQDTWINKALNLIILPAQGKLSLPALWAALLASKIDPFATSACHDFPRP